MMLPEHTLRSLAAVQTMSVRSAQAKGIIPDDREILGGYRSLAEKLTAEAEAKKTQKSRKQRIAERRRLQLQEQQRRDNNMTTDTQQNGQGQVDDGTRAKDSDGVS